MGVVCTSLRNLPFVVAAVAGWALVPDAAGQTFQGLGWLPGGGSSYANAVSADGMSIVGKVRDAGFQFHAVRWTRTSSSAVVIQDLGFLGQSSFPPSSSATAVSADGSVVVGYSSTAQSGAARAFRWTSATGMVNIGNLGASLVDDVKALGVSADGSKVTGASPTPTSVGRPHAFRWSIAGGMQDLSTGLPSISGNGSYGYAISGDGTTVVGTTGFEPVIVDRGARWTAGQGWQALGTGNGGTPGFFDYGYGTNGDGSIAVGKSYERSVSAWRAYVWSNGTATPLGLVNGLASSEAYAISVDGSVVVGDGYAGVAVGDAVAAMWTHGSAMDLNQYLPTLGINLTGWTLGVASGVSADGQVIVGRGVHLGHDEAWLVDLHPSVHCGSADFNHDGDVGTDQDIEAFFACLAGNCCTTCETDDFNGDGDVGTDADIEAFFRVLGGGTC